MCASPERLGAGEFPCLLALLPLATQHGGMEETARMTAAPDEYMCRRLCAALTGSNLTLDATVLPHLQQSVRTTKGCSAKGAAMRAGRQEQRGDKCAVLASATRRQADLFHFVKRGSAHANPRMYGGNER